MTAGALLSREYPQVGFITAVCSMAAYVCADIGRVAGYIKNIKTADSPVKVRFAMWVLFLVITISAIITHKVSYFFVLVLLGLDYLLTIRSEDNEKNG